MERLAGNKALKILNNENFDTIYSVLFYLQDVSITTRKEILQILEQGLKSLVQHIGRTKVLQWADQNFISTESL
jgi:hypothetical protein